MKLFKLEGFKIVISEEAFAIKVFREIWNRDRSASKEKAIMELGFLYFFLDPRSNYSYLTDEDEKLALIKTHQGFPEKWVPDKKLIEAMEVYKSLTITESSLLLDSARKAAKQIWETLSSFDLNETLLKEGIKVLPAITRALESIPKVSENLAKAEKAINNEIEENSKMRANREKTVLEDGFDKFKKRK